MPPHRSTRSCSRQLWCWMRHVASHVPNKQDAIKSNMCLTAHSALHDCTLHNPDVLLRVWGGGQADWLPANVSVAAKLPGSDLPAKFCLLHASRDVMSYTGDPVSAFQRAMRGRALAAAGPHLQGHEPPQPGALQVSCSQWATAAACALQGFNCWMMS